VALVVHAMLWLTGGARRPLKTTTRVLCFCYGPQLFVIVPVLGSLVGSLWMLWLAIVGLREAHETDGWRAAVAVLIPFFGMLLVMVLVMVLYMAGGAGILPGGLDIGGGVG
jgi:hypothetical protein